MKYLSEYTEKPIAEAMDKAGAFFAFSRDQFNEKKKEGVKYANAGMGLICPVENVDTLIEEINKAHREGIAQDILDHGADRIILRELNNHEAFYTRDIESTVEALAGYGFEREHIERVFKHPTLINKEPVTA